MADDAKAAASPEGAKKKRPIGLIVGAAVGALALLGGGVGVGWVLKPAAPAAADPAAAPAEAAEGGAAPPEAGGAGGVEGAAAPLSEVVSLGRFTVNLRDSAGGRLLQMEISLEGDSAVAKIVADKEAQLRDSVLMLASDYTYAQLEGLDGRLQLRDEIHRRANAIVAPSKVNRVYFTEFVIQ